ncbi:MAG: putative phospholipid ABC transporter permease protein MlaE [Alphaproteobacteria bacterium ADurb.Bin438]|nr:MAG: putative phospholipid ABC transporter permease protein MlaE [Alphaproteobacteria bacterium ADurb.Bin438]
MNFLSNIGKMTVKFIKNAGELALFAYSVITHLFRPPFFFKNIFTQMIEIGFYSLPVVGLTTLFSGMVMALQTYSGFSRLSAESAIPMVVLIALTRELAPVMAGLMVAGRVGASFAAEIGTMKVTEQIDALSSLSTNPIKYLVVPRIIAATLMLPFLVFIGDVIGIQGGYLIGVHKLGFNSATYIKNTWDVMESFDIVSGLIKAAVFGFIIAMLGCYNGYYSDGGAQGVGKATTNAVVSSSILILIFNYILTELFFMA